jgi:hypothetical protein
MRIYRVPLLFALMTFAYPIRREVLGAVSLRVRKIGTMQAADPAASCSDRTAGTEGPSSGVALVNVLLETKRFSGRNHGI